MAKKEEEKKAQAQEVDENDFRTNNLINEPSLVEAAMADLKKDKDEKKKSEIKTAIGEATYYNSKTRAERRARRREDRITGEKLEKSKVLLERLIGFECEIVNGCLVPTKTKCKEPVLTPTEYKEEKRKLEESIRTKMQESDKELSKDLNEIRNGYEGRYRPWWD